MESFLGCETIAGVEITYNMALSIEFTMTYTPQFSFVIYASLFFSLSCLEDFLENDFFPRHRMYRQVFSPLIGQLENVQHGDKFHWYYKGLTCYKC